MKKCCKYDWLSLLAGAAMLLLLTTCIKNDFTSSDMVGSDMTELRSGVLQITPAELDFGDVEVGTTARETLMLRNVGDNTLHISLITFNFTSIFYCTYIYEVFLMPPNWGASPEEEYEEIVLLFTPPAPGEYKDSLCIYSIELLPLYPYYVQVRGTGIMPGIGGILNAFDTGIADGSILAKNPGQIQAIPNALLQAQAAYKAGDNSTMCQRLQWFYLRSVHPRRPISMIFGPGVELLNQTVCKFMTDHGCQF
ncbi:MAG: hypothetical protein IPN33_16830 [Saprospiraceae bacterium]|nr:hypothetical protein [Saprospiraceae bacterium]